MGIVVNTKDNNSYINGIKPDSSWHKKLVEAGCSETKTNNLKIPDGKEPKDFLNDTLGSKNIEKYGGAEYHNLDSKKATKPVEEKKVPLGVTTITGSGALEITGLTKEDAAAREIIKANGGKFINADKNNPHWKIENPKIEQTELYKQLKSVLVNGKEASVSKKDEPKPDANKEAAFEVVEKKGKVYVNGIKPDSSWHKKLVEAGCSVANEVNLLIPEGKKASTFLNAVLGKENIIKHGGYSYKKEDKPPEESMRDDSIAEIIDRNQKVSDMTLGELNTALKALAAESEPYQVATQQ